MKVGDYHIKVTASQTGSGWTATAILPDGQKVISGPSSTEEGAKHDVCVQAKSRLYPKQKVEFTKQFESMSKETAILKRRADGLIDEVVGRDWVPPHQNVDDDTEMEMAAKSPFTAWEYALRRNKHHPRLQQAVKGSAFDSLYRRQFKIPQDDPFYEGVKSEADSLLEAPGVYDISDEGDLLDNPECPQCGGPGVPLGSLGSLLHFRCRNCGWNFSQPQEPMTPPPMAEANFASPDERRALKRRRAMPRKKAAFYPSDGGGGGGGGGFTSV